MVSRFIGWFKDFGILVGGVIVNMQIDKNQVKPESPEFVHNRVAMQDRYMEEIQQKFNGTVRAVLPLYETEVRSVPMLMRTAEPIQARLRPGFTDTDL